MKRKTKITTCEDRREIFYNIINSALAGLLVLLGSFTAVEGITLRGVLFAFIAAAIVMITKFKDYWDGEKSEYTAKLMQFVG